MESLVPGAVCGSLGTVGSCEVGDTNEPASRVTISWLDNDDVVTRVQICVVFE